MLQERYISDYPLLLVVFFFVLVAIIKAQRMITASLSSVPTPFAHTMEKQRRSITGRFWSTRPKFSEKNEPLYLERFQIAYTYCTLVMYTNRACSFHLNKGLHDSYPVSVVKADRVQGGGAISCVRREISISVATNGPFW